MTTRDARAEIAYMDAEDATYEIGRPVGAGYYVRCAYNAWQGAVSTTAWEGPYVSEAQAAFYGDAIVRRVIASGVVEHADRATR